MALIGTRFKPVFLLFIYIEDFVKLYRGMTRTIPGSHMYWTRLLLMEIVITGWTWAIGLEKPLQDKVNLFYLLPPTKWGISLKFRNEYKSLDLSDRFALNQFDENLRNNASNSSISSYKFNWICITAESVLSLPRYPWVRETYVRVAGRIYVWTIYQYFSASYLALFITSWAC